jgi:hypothetical protein
MLYPVELRALRGLRGTDVRPYVRLRAVDFLWLLLGSDLRSLSEYLLVFYQAIYGQIAIAVNLMFRPWPRLAKYRCIAHPHRNERWKAPILREGATLPSRYTLQGSHRCHFGLDQRALVAPS